MVKLIEHKCCDACRHELSKPCPDMVACFTDGPICHQNTDCKQQRLSKLAYLRREAIAKPVIFVGTGTCGLSAGAGKTLAAVKNWLSNRGISADVVEVGCVGLCSAEPIIDIQMPGRNRVSFQSVTESTASALLEKVFAGEMPSESVIGQYRSSSFEPWTNLPYIDEHPFFAPQTRWVLANCGIIDPSSIEEYIARGGYRAFADAIRGNTPAQLCDIVEASGLRGRGGGGFPTGKKQKYLICNADEGDPGAFMDRAVIEGDPHRLLEGMGIAAYSIGATKAYVYIRAEYPLAIKRLKEAIAQAKAYGLLNYNILDSGFNLEIIIKQGAGAFVCGEETALIQSIEGKRGMPRPRPPFPAVQGLFGKPTVINNVETLANLPPILSRGAEWYAGMGTGGSKGTKVFALSGMVRRTGLVEIPMGTTLRRIVFNIGGGISNNKKCKAVQIGGPSGGCIPEAHLDIPTDYEALKNFGTIMGSGGLVVLDESTCMVDFAKFFMEFIQNESCGKCIPCREGTRRMLEILNAITQPSMQSDDLEALFRFQGIMRLQSLAEMIRATSLCGLGQTAPNPVLSTLRWFRNEYEAHVYDRRCPAGRCEELTGIPCQNSCPVGTEAWRYVAHIGHREYQEAYRVIRAANPFPSVCARVCDHPCERGCRAGATGGQPIAIRTLKRFVVDRVQPTAPAVKRAEPNAARIAVIGAGPAGLTAAHYLSLKGHKVIIFEREAQPGGMLTSAIPAYRLPRDVLRREIDALLNENIELKCNTALGRDFTIDGLLKDGFYVVYVSTGAHKSRKLDLPGEEAQGIIAGLKFLKAHNIQGKELAKGKVGVIGGGNSALDAARVALRQTGVESVTIFYRRTRAEMPAYAEEIEAALEEGIRIEELVAPVAVHNKDGRLGGVRFLRNRLGNRDASGRQKPVPILGSEFDVEIDTLIVAISEAPETEVLAGLAVTKDGTLAIRPETYVTDRAGVFGGGDVVSGPSSVIQAIAAGKNAAVMIGRYVTGKLLKVLPKSNLPSIYIEPVKAADDGEAAATARVTSPKRPASERKRDFCEEELCVSEKESLREARRCLRCDLHYTQQD
jgi:NADH-quinone oxidoreductase subunit F